MVKLEELVKYCKTCEFLEECKTDHAHFLDWYETAKDCYKDKKNYLKETKE